MPSAGFQPATPATKQPQTYALDRAATEVGAAWILLVIKLNKKIKPNGHNTTVKTIIKNNKI
jgi:hypothetical protein